jgi:hypothetical protein
LVDGQQVVKDGLHSEQVFAGKKLLGN